MTTTTNPNEAKICTICGGKPKPLSDFYATKAGYTDECKSCHILTVLRGRNGRNRPSDKILAAFTGRWRVVLNRFTETRCTACGGVMVKGDKLCECVYRKITKELLHEYHNSQGTAGCAAGQITERRAVGGLSYSRKHQEFVADVELLVKRVARRLDAEGIFTSHLSLATTVLLQGMTQSYWLQRHPQCSMHQRASHAITRLTNHIAKEAVELQPYALYPMEHYFHLSGANVSPLAVA